MSDVTLKNTGEQWFVCDETTGIVGTYDTAEAANTAVSDGQFVLPPGHTHHVHETLGEWISDDRVNRSGKSSETVHSELYRDYLIAVEFVAALTPEEDVFGANVPDRYRPLIDGQDVVNAGLVTRLGDAIVAAKKHVDRTLLHPITGRTLTRVDREAVTIEDLG